MANCSWRFSCTGLAVILSVIVGIVAALLTVTGTVVISPVFLLVALSIAVVALVLLFLGAVFGNLGCSACRRAAVNTLLVGIIGALITGVILIAATSILGAIITGLLLAFLTLIFASAACFVRCTAECCE